jgi:Na+/melibiose symporter-like transporter
MIGWILSVIPIYFYKFVGKERERIYAELNERRKAKEINAET